jgi:hypothetical protein
MLYLISHSGLHLTTLKLLFNAAKARRILNSIICRITAIEASISTSENE